MAQPEHRGSSLDAPGLAKPLLVQKGGVRPSGDTAEVTPRGDGQVSKQQIWAGGLFYKGVSCSPSGLKVVSEKLSVTQSGTSNCM